ncbi:MAG: gamma subclass chorismate mutase AroQ [Planctomycetota bacterium]|nr:gamma subclass chorismate mutase AroQ [Planctomycetota bacterium]
MNRTSHIAHRTTGTGKFIFMIHRFLIAIVVLIGCAETEVPPSAVVVPSLTSEQRQAVVALVDLTVQRLQLMPGVALYKWNHKLPIENIERENELLHNLVEQGADAGVPDEIITPFFERQFMAAKELQRHSFEVWEKNESTVVGKALDLATEIRPEIDRISGEMIARLVILQSVWGEEATQRVIDASIETFESERSMDDDAVDKELVDAVRRALGTHH